LNRTGRSPGRRVVGRGMRKNTKTYPTESVARSTVEIGHGKKKKEGVSGKNCGAGRHQSRRFGREVRTKGRKSSQEG